MTKGTLAGRASQLLQSYLNNITKHSSDRVPILGPVTTKTVLVYQVPLCINRTPTAGKFLGHLDNTCAILLSTYSLPLAGLTLLSSKQPLFGNLFSSQPGPPSQQPSQQMRPSSSAQVDPSPALAISCGRFAIHSHNLIVIDFPFHGLTHSKFGVQTWIKYIFFENTTTGTTQITPKGSFQPLSGATLTGSLSVWKNVKNKHIYFFIIENTFCLGNQESVFYALLIPIFVSQLTGLGLVPSSILLLKQTLPLIINLLKFLFLHIPGPRGASSSSPPCQPWNSYWPRHWNRGTGNILSYYQSLSKDLAKSLEEITRVLLHYKTRCTHQLQLPSKIKEDLTFLQLRKGDYAYSQKKNAVFMPTSLAQ